MHLTALFSGYVVLAIIFARGHGFFLPKVSKTRFTRQNGPDPKTFVFQGEENEENQPETPNEGEDIQHFCTCMPSCDDSWSELNDPFSNCPIKGEVCCIPPDGPVIEIVTERKKPKEENIVPKQKGTHEEDMKERNCSCVSILECGAGFRLGENEEDQHDNICGDPDKVCCPLIGLTMAEKEDKPKIHPNCTCVSVLNCGAKLRVGGEEEEESNNFCTEPGEVCCSLNESPLPDIAVNPLKVSEANIQPNCTCVSELQCGGGLRISEDEESGHDLCTEPGEVCCSNFDTPPKEDVPESPNCECVYLLDCDVTLRVSTDEGYCSTDEICCLIPKQPSDGDKIKEQIKPNCTCVSLLKCGATLKDGAEYSEEFENVCSDPGEVCCVTPLEDKTPTKTENSPAVEKETPNCQCTSVLKCGATYKNSLSEGDYDEYDDICTIPGEVCCVTPLPGETTPTAEEKRTTEKPQQCNCVPIMKCGPGLNSAVGWGEDVNQCQRPDEICCNNPEAEEEAPGVDGQEPLTCGEALHFSPVKSSLPLTKDSAEFGELPWTVLIYNRTENSGLDVNKCAGSLIQPNAVITAAHCIAGLDPSIIVVRAGEWDLLTESFEPLPYQEKEVDYVVTHPQYRSGYPTFDVAVIVMKTPFELSDHINTVCLPNSLDDVEIEQCVSSGWGKSPSGNSHTILKKIAMPIVPRKPCQQALKKTRLGPYFRLHKSYLCAGGNGADVCLGDGGGPLTCPSKTTGKMTLVGVTSWGIGCGQNGVPGVFSDVIYVNSWLSNVLQEVSER